jgi:hypothetical protein
MKVRMTCLLGLLLTVAFGMAGCGSGDGWTGIVPAQTGTYLPVTVGSTWSYKRSDNVTQSQKITGNINNQVTREVVDTTTGKSVATISISNNAFYLARIDLYDAVGTIITSKTYSPSPGQLFFPSSTLPGTHETQTVQINTQPANITLSQSIDVTVVGFENISVPAGTFSNALKVQTIISPNTVYTSWFALNVGMIRQDLNNEKIVELTSYNIL